MNIVLMQPEIAPNVGNVARLCAGTRAVLHLIEPFGFVLDDRRLRRAGMDYWRWVDWHRWESWPAFLAGTGAGGRIWMIESDGPRRYSEVSFAAGDYLLFGRETAGLPLELLTADPDRWLRIPMMRSEARSLNLANCVALTLFEALRQQGFPGEVRPGR